MKTGFELSKWFNIIAVIFTSPFSSTSCWLPPRFKNRSVGLNNKMNKNVLFVYQNNLKVGAFLQRVNMDTIFIKLTTTTV